MHERPPERGGFRLLPRDPAQRRRLLIGAGLCVTVVGPMLAALFIAARSYRAEASLFGGHRRQIPLREGTDKISGLVAVTFPLPGGEAIKGWYKAPGDEPGKQRAAVILAHGSGGDRRNVLDEAALLAQAGLGVLLFDSPGHGESEGRITWGQEERAALVAALDFLADRDGVNSHSIGVAGFSMGGVIATQVAANDLRVAALALLGTPSDLEQQTYWEYRRWGFLSTAPALWALRRNGLDVTAARPKDLLGQLAPRPVLIVNGGADDTVPPFMADDLFAAAGEPKQRLVVQGAAHGDYLNFEPKAYAETLTTFFSRNLSTPK